MKMKVKKGDKIKVTTGKHKGTEGTVSKVLVKKQRVLVEGVNVKKKTIKDKDSANKENFIFIQHSIHISNVQRLEGSEEVSVAKSENNNSKKKSVKGEAKKKSSTKAE